MFCFFIKFPVGEYFKIKGFAGAQALQVFEPIFAFEVFLTWMIFKMRAYSASTPNTWMIQETTLGEDNEKITKYNWKIDITSESEIKMYYVRLGRRQKLPKSRQQWAPRPLARCQSQSWRCWPTPGTGSPAGPFDLQVSNWDLVNGIEHWIWSSGGLQPLNIIIVMQVWRLSVLPGTTSGGTMKEIQDTIMKSPVVR